MERDLIGATQIPVAPRFVLLSFPRPFFKGHGVGCRETTYISNHKNISPVFEACMIAILEQKFIIAIYELLLE